MNGSWQIAYLRLRALPVCFGLSLSSYAYLELSVVLDLSEALS